MFFFLAVPRLLCSPLGKASTTVLVIDEGTGTKSRFAAKSQEFCSLVLEDISVVSRYARECGGFTVGLA